MAGVSGHMLRLVNGTRSPANPSNVLKRFQFSPVNVVQQWLFPSARSVSTGRRDFYQRINEQHLARELEEIGRTAAHGVEAGKPLPFDPSMRSKPSRSHRPSFASQGRETSFSNKDFAATASFDSLSSNFSEFVPSSRAKPWLGYESLRGETYPVRAAESKGPRSGSKHEGPRWQDLTHSEAQRLQELYMRKRMLDRKVLWMKMQNLPNPQKEAKMALRKQQRADDVAKDDVDMYPPPFLDTHPSNKRLENMLEWAKQDELESRFRNRIRQQKLENARIVKATVPSVGGVTIDPIKRHVNRRLVRQRVKIHAGLEEVLTHNTAQILYEFLRGVAISIIRISAQRPRQTQLIHYNLTSDHDPAWVQRQLDVLAPKLRSQLAVKVNLGQTPNIRFVPNARTEESKRSYLWKFARAITPQIPLGGVRPADERMARK